MIRLILVLLLLLSGCASLPPPADRLPSTAITDTDNTILANKWRSYTPPNSGDSGVVLLPEGMDAFVARATLAKVATHGIDVQYYLWHDDLVGLSLLALLKESADRGVRVRLLLDDIDLAGQDQYLAALSEHPQFEIRVFNPFSRGSNRGLQYVSRFGSVTRRMHNKSFTVDNQATIIGGRNIGDEYFEADPNVAFGDLDAMAIGPVVTEVSSAFDSYWNSALAYSIQSLAKRSVTAKEEREVSEFLDQYLLDNDQSPYAKALRESAFIKAFQENALPFEWGRARVIVDAPEKISESRSRTDLHLSNAVSEVFAESKEELIVFSPYFIPGDDGSEGLIRLAEQGATVRIVTNSLASNNHPIVHAKYAKYRRRLLEAGVELYEVRAESELKDIDTPFGGTKESVLHAKLFIVDRKTVFIGSLNFDPRSFVENTEIGIVVNSEVIASEVGRWFDENISKVSYRLSLESPAGDRDRLVWIDATDPSNLSHITAEPKTSWWSRFKVKLMSLLPIESQL